MGKVKRLRQKFHTSLAKERKSKESNDLPAPGILQLVPMVKKIESDEATASGNMFAGLQIKLGETENMPASKTVDTSDTRSMTSVSSNKQSRCTKKERRRQRHEEFMQKIDVIRASAKAERERKKREKTAIVGDMHPLLNALPSLEELIATSTSKTDVQASKKVKGTKKVKERQKDFISDVQMFMAIQEDPVYKNDPFGAVSKAIENRVLNAQEDS
ncbi:ribosome biogenesis protein SLX9 homolog [Procambarus clarkii]|uniref:ribosome biogenesis protein SLX9 homolog n=1 Tax=Procambarus clarkii TaxID=6728 RepID=UPI001E67158D|nr:ribosome biogenesis protein SLX9 homolog [Procambarus clarkii]